MPINGNADPAQLTQYAPTMAALDTEALTLPDVKVLQVIYEIDDAVMAELLPPALHPTIPPDGARHRDARRGWAAGRVHDSHRPGWLSRRCASARSADARGLH